MTAVSATQPVRSLVVALGGTNLGRKFLTSLSPFRGIYPSVELAWKASGRNRHSGHEHQEAVDRHVPMAESLLPSDYAVVYWLRRLSGDVHLFDYGGNMGNVFYGCIRYLESSRVKWTVYDLPKVVEAGREFAKEREGLKPQFTASVDDATDANVLLVSGAYHYWEKSTAEFLNQFSKLPEHVFINRSPFYQRDCEPVVSMQSTLNFAFPIVIRSVKELMDGFAGLGYTLVDEWTAAEYGHVMPFFPEKSVSAYSGFYFRLSEKPE